MEREWREKWDIRYTEGQGRRPDGHGNEWKSETDRGGEVGVGGGHRQSETRQRPGIRKAPRNQSGDSQH